MVVEATRKRERFRTKLDNSEVNKETYPSSRLIEMQRRPRRVLLLQLDDVVFEVFQPGHEGTRWCRN